MSWLFSRALVAAFSGANSSDGEPCAQLNVMPTPHAFLRNDRMMEPLSLSQFGLTCALLTEPRGAELLTWCREVSRARTFPPPERVPELGGGEAACGSKWHALLVRFDRATCGWRTVRCLWDEGLDWSSLTLPRWGSLHDGELWERMTPALRTSGNESGLWPTPKASAAGPDFAKVDRSATGISLPTAVAMWPTPNVPNGGRRVPKDATIKGGKTPTAYTVEGKKCQVGLEQAVQWWPTPHGMSKDGKSNGPSGNELGRAVNQSLKFPTPRAEDSQCAGGHRGKDDTLYGMICRPKETWGTPRASDAKGSGPKGSKSQIKMEAKGYLCGQVATPESGGSLNPTWVEWLMGWPLGWTDCAASGTDRFQQWCDSHGVSCVSKQNNNRVSDPQPAQETP